jgi:hypothetical protein
MAINAVGDEFQMPDDQRYWAHDMPGEMNLVMLPDADHTCATGVPEIIESGSSFIQAVQQHVARPNYTWAINDTPGEITVKTNIKPKEVVVWFGESPKGVSSGKRDFRWAAINATVDGKCLARIFGACIRPVLWAPWGAKEVSPLTYTASMDPIPGRWRGFVIELHWENPMGGEDFVFSSPVSVIPNTRPFPAYCGEACRGSLM